MYSSSSKIVCDHVNSVGGVLKVEFSKPLQWYVRQRYEK